MTVLVTVDLPVNRSDIEAVSSEMGVGENPPDGLIAHVATESGGMTHVVDIWESAEQFERFAAERLGPTSGKVMADRGNPLSQPPSATITEAFDLVVGR